jgi:hypothetical protein
MHDALVHLFLGDDVGLDADYARALALDHDRRQDGDQATDLADHVLYMRASVAPTRGTYLMELKAIRDADPDPELEQRIAWHLDTDPVIEAKRLVSDSRYNRGAKLVNDAVRPLGEVTSLLLSTVNPILLASSVADSVGSVVTNLRAWRQPSRAERRALSQYRQHLRSGGDVAPLRGSVRGLREKVAAADCENALTAARDAMDSDPGLARAHLRVAEGIVDCDDRAAELLAEVDSHTVVDAADMDRGLWPADPLPPVAPEARASYDALLVALVQGYPGDIRRAADALEASTPESGLRDEARYAHSVAADLEGDHEAALSQLREVADDDSTNMGRHAEIHLENPETDRYETVRDAVRDHRREVTRFVLFGQRPTLRSALRSAARTGAGGLRAVHTLGIFNVIGVATRAVRSWRSDPISNADIVAAGEEFVAREPDSPNATAVHLMLASAYERDGEYRRALFHVGRTDEPDDERIDELVEKAAGQTLRLAKATPSPARKRVLLGMIVQQYPETKAANKATAALEKLGGAPPPGPVLSATALRADPALADRLGLPAAWRDGQSENGEIGAGGIRLVSPDRALVTVETPDGPVERPIMLDQQRTAMLGAAIDEAAYREAANRLQQPRASSLGRLIPFYLQGTVGESGIAVFPGIKPRQRENDETTLYGD